MTGKYIIKLLLNQTIGVNENNNFNEFNIGLLKSGSKYNFALLKPLLNAYYVQHKQYGVDSTRWERHP